jgi:hypothetical protein
MTVIEESIDISVRPEEVFVYATDFSHFPNGRRESGRSTAKTMPLSP